MEFRKKPVVIEAMQFDGTLVVGNKIQLWIDGRQHAVNENDPEHLECITINTPEGDMRADPGAWIIRGVKGEFYPCKPEIFAATYERVEPPADTNYASGMDIAGALAFMRDGYKVQRAGWNGKGMWLKLVQTETYPAGNLCGHLFDTPIDVMAHICLYTADGKWQPGWNASTPDLLATDWQVVLPGADG